MKPVAMGLFHTLHNEQKAVQIAACAEGVAGNMGMAVIEGAQAGAARAVLNEAQLLLQNFHIDLMTKLEPEIAVLKVVFDNRVKGFGEFANKYIKIDYEHILGMDLSFSKRGILQIGGFHHGFMHVVKKSNMFEFVDEVIHASGFYKAKVFHKGYFVKEITFFPADWSREKVINSIHEAYDSFIKSGMAPFVESNGKYRIEGYTKNGIQVRMYITKKGLITTVYPLLP